MLHQVAPKPGPFNCEEEDVQEGHFKPRGEEALFSDVSTCLRNGTRKID
jgi:hypothetical protein